MYLFCLFGCEKENHQESINSASFTDLRDGEIYTTITIGSQTWMAENLRFNASGSFLNPANPSLEYGRLYDWATSMNGNSPSTGNPSGVQGICPSGWHLPSDTEWNVLEVVLGLNPVDTNLLGLYPGNHAPSMKSITGWNGLDGTNSSGLNIYPAGVYSVSNNYFGDLGEAAYFWSTVSIDTTYAGTRFFHAGLNGVARGGNPKMAGQSCRCLMD
jgi:uncharacterized protein (TIGR02145 family)